ncbi:MAG: hypothetical protein Q8L48_11680 [Archangium sp.]|nr:hypothetical protein [Archangium sp.]
MNKQEDAFVRSGFEFYPQAINAIDAFARLLGDELRQAVSRVNAPIGLQLEECEQQWSERPGRGCWVCADVPVMKGKTKFSVEFGWWWGAPGAPPPVVAYCRLRKENRVMRLDRYTSVKVETGKIDGEWGLFTKNTDNREQAIESLLNEALRIIVAD